jgi:hypothetical protein
MDGSGHPGFGIPDFRDQVGYFLRLAEGRAFLMQVPGLLSAGLPDQRTAAVTNYVIETFAGDSLRGVPPLAVEASATARTGRRRDAPSCVPAAQRSQIRAQVRA